MIQLNGGKDICGVEIFYLIDNALITFVCRTPAVKGASGSETGCCVHRIRTVFNQEGRCR